MIRFEHPKLRSYRLDYISGDEACDPEYRLFIGKQETDWAIQRSFGEYLITEMTRDEQGNIDGCYWHGTYPDLPTAAGRLGGLLLERLNLH